MWLTSRFNGLPVSPTLLNPTWHPKASIKNDDYVRYFLFYFGARAEWSDSSSLLSFDDRFYQLVNWILEVFRPLSLF